MVENKRPMHRFKTVFLLLVILVGANGGSTVRAQSELGSNKILSYATVLDGDTIPLVHLKTVLVVRKWALLSEKEIRKNQFEKTAGPGDIPKHPFQRLLSGA